MVQSSYSQYHIHLGTNKTGAGDLTFVCCLGYFDLNHYLELEHPR